MLGQVTEKEAADRAPKLSHLGGGCGCPVPQGKNEPNTPELLWGIQLNLTVGKQSPEENGLSQFAWEATPVYIRHAHQFLSTSLQRSAPTWFPPQLCPPPVTVIMSNGICK